MDAEESSPGDGSGGMRPVAQPSGALVEDALFDSFREHVESMIARSRSQEPLGLEHDAVEEQVLALGFEAMRLLTEGAYGASGGPGRPAVRTWSMLTGTGG
jgi:hypothetical protein